MLLLVFAGLWVLVVDDQVDLVGGTTLIRTEHDYVWGSVGELFLVKSFVVAEKLEVSTTALETICNKLDLPGVCRHRNRLTLKLYLILHDQSLALVVDLLWEFGRNGMVSSSILDDESFVALHTLEHSWLLDSPFTNVCPFLVFLLRALGVLLGVRWLPSLFPVVCELLDEVTLDF